MKATYTSKEPLAVQFLKKYDDKVLYMLRKDIVKSSISNPLTGKTIDSWTCDEIQVETYYKDDIEADITNNFNAYFALGEKQYQDKVDLENKKEQTKKLINGGIYQQIGLNDTAKQQLNGINDAINNFINWYFTKHPEEM